jgi:transposase
VAIDLSAACVKGVRENLGNAALVFGKFHVISQVVQAVEDVRRSEARQDEQARAPLERTCWLWRKNPETWTAQESSRWEQLKDKPLVTGLAYAMRLELQKAYRAGSAGEARGRFEAWCRWVRTEAAALKSGLLAPMGKAAAMVERHWEGMLGHWRKGLTTAFLEGLNSLFSATKRKARGYRSTEYQTAMPCFVAGKLEIPCC